MSTMGYVTTLTGAEDAANLSLDFERQNYRIMEGGKLVSKQFSDLITFTRASAGGRFNSKGLYESVAVNQPRFDYDPITKALKGLLVEEQRTNLVRDSTITSIGQTWTKSPGLVIGQPTIAPDGLLAATCLGNSTVGSFLQQAAVIPSTGVHTFSFFCKPQEGFPFSMVFELDGGGRTITFNASTKTFSGNATISNSYTDLPNGWIRASFTVSTVASSLTIYIGAYGATNTINKGYVWGVQIEAAAFPTSYIQTDVSFVSRASTATYFNSKGVLITAGINVPRTGAYGYDATGKLTSVGTLFEGASTNLIKRAGELMTVAPWVYTGGSLEAVIGLDGALSANKFTEGLGVTSAKEVRQIVAVSIVSGTTYTYSVYAKPSGGRSGRLRIGFGNNGIITDLQAQATFNLDNKSVVVADNVATNIQNLPDGWARYSVTVTATITGNAPIYMTSLGGEGGVGDGVSGFIVYGPQVEAGQVATSYVKPSGTFTGRASTATYFDRFGVMQTADVNVPRTNAFTGAGLPIGLLLENSATNMVIQSQDYTKWTAVGPGTASLVVTPNSGDGPRGASTMTLLARADLGIKSIRNTGTLTATTSAVSFSQVAKVGPNGSGFLVIRLVASGSIRVDAWYNLATGECGDLYHVGATLTSLSMSKVGDAWDCKLVATSPDSPWTQLLIGPHDRIGTVDTTPIQTTSIYVDCTQLEVGSTQTSYIPTATAAVTRAADVYTSTQATRAADVTTSIATSRAAETPEVPVGTWYNQPAGTLVVDAVQGLVGSQVANFAQLAGSVNYYGVRIFNSTVASAAIIRDTTDVNLQVTGGMNDRKRAVRIKVGDYALSSGGGDVRKSTSTQVVTPTRLEVGSGTAFKLNGHVKSVLYYPIALSDSQLQLITA